MDQSAEDGERFVISCSGAFTGSAARGPIEVLVSGGVIEGLSVNRKGSVSAGRHIDLDGALLLPGFIDSHVHIGFFSPAEVLRGGVTTARDLGWPREEIFALARRSERPDFPGPLILAAGPMLTAPGGYPTRAAWAPAGTGLPVADEHEGAQAVAALARDGADVIKVALNAEVGPTVSEGVLSSITAAAHAHGLRVTAHIYGLAELQKALDAGVDELAHMLMSEEIIPPHMLDQMLQQETVVVPTLGIHPPASRATAIKNLRAFATAGGTVVYGTDLGNEGPLPGIDRREIEAMHAAGMTAAEIIRSATVTARTVLQLQSGLLEEGLPADLIAVPMEATRSPGALADVKFVMRGGRLVRGPEA